MLPHRQQAARRLRRRRLAECASSALLGVGAALACNALGPFEMARLTERRAKLEATWSSLAGPLAQYRQLGSRFNDERQHVALSAQFAAPRTVLLKVVDALAGEAGDGVALHRLQQHGDSFELKARAVNSATAAAWVGRLERVRGIDHAEIAELRLVDGHDHAVELDVRLRPRLDGVEPSQAADAAQQRRVREARSRP
ncbi:hypothetical protein [Trinickia fusca]|uniref:Fimbrial protein n=1 Tax=Trinickia fusca TaxID=2419777 RepID=A0A494X143_9BURK|nr:hypothetical protein [Trinickia fusca]RKP44042.1 hypothetical protein D7S89_24240 [Trinickia fusca]